MPRVPEPAASPVKDAGSSTAAGPALADLSRSNLAERTIRVLNRGHAGNPDVLLVGTRDRPIVVKDFAPRPRWLRLAGRVLATWEVRAWRAVDGHPSVPRFLGRLDPLAFCLEYCPGARLAGRKAGELPASFLKELEAAVVGLHARGVVHLDLSHRSNVLIDGAGSPILIDFGAAIAFRAGGRAARWLLPWLARLDLRALRKWRRKLNRYRPESATPLE